MNADYLDAVANRSAANQNDYLADQYQRIGDQFQQLGRLNRGDMSGDLYGRVGNQYQTAAGLNRIRSIVTQSNQPTPYVGGAPVGRGEIHGLKEFNEAYQQAKNPYDYNPYANPVTVDFTASRQQNLAEQQRQDVLGQAEKAAQQQFYIPGIGYSDTAPYPGYGMQQFNAQPAKSPEELANEEIDKQLSRGTQYNGAAGGVPRYAIQRQIELMNQAAAQQRGRRYFRG